MKEVPSPFCPKSCLFQGDGCEYTDCDHKRDEVFDTPYTINVNGTDVTALGRNKVWIYIKDKFGISSVHQNAPFIKW